MKENSMESLGARKTYDGREFWRNAAEAGRYVNNTCQRANDKNSKIKDVETSAVANKSACELKIYT